MEITTKILGIIDYGHKRPAAIELSFNDVVTLLERDNENEKLSWHYEIQGENEVYHVYLDVDKNYGKSIDEIVHDVSDYFQLDINDIKLTRNYKKEFSHHIDIPKRYGYPVDIHYHIKKIIEQYKWNPAQYDSGVYPNGKSKKKEIDELGKVRWTEIVSTRLYRLPNQGKPSKDNTPFDTQAKHIIINGNTVDFIPDYITDDAIRIEPAPTKTAHASHRTDISNVNVNLNQLDKLIECLSAARAEDYPTWSKVGWALFNVGGTIEQFLRFSQKSENYDEDGCISHFNSSREDNLKMGSLVDWAKEDNPELYAKLFPKKTSICLITDEDQDIEQINYFMCASIFSKGMREMCNVISNELFKMMRYCLDCWYVFEKKTGLWTIIKNPASKFIELFNKYFNFNIMRISKELMSDGLNDDKRKQLSEDRKLFISACVKYDTCGNHSVMKTHFSDLLVDNKFVEKLDRLTDCIAFDNGIYNLKTGLFQNQIKFDDYLTCKLNLPYKEPSETAFQRVKTIISQICSMEEWRMKYYKTLLGYAMTGRANEQQAFYSMTGIGSNGKSFVFEQLSKIFPQYVYKIPSNTFEKDCKDYNKNISCVVGKRIVWSNELSKNKQSDADKLKDFSDGTIMNIPFLYQQKPVLIKNNAKLFLISNQSPKFASDGGIDRRLRAINFVSRFYKEDEIIPFPASPNPSRDYWVDATIDSFFETADGSLALFKFIAEGAKMYFEQGLTTPVEFKQLADDVANANNQFIEFITENLEIVEEGKGIVHKDDVMAAWKKEKGKDCCFDDLRSELIRRKYIYDTKHQVRIQGKRKTGCFTNMRIIQSFNQHKCLLDDDELSNASTPALFIDGVEQCN